VLEQEPTSTLPLRWGTYRRRYLGGLAGILVGGVLLVLTNTYFLTGLLAGTVLHLAGWLVLPAARWRRVAAAGPSFLGVAALLAGPTMTPMLVLPFLCWLLARHRPALSAVAAALPLATGLLLARLLHGYPDLGLAVTLTGIVLVFAAWAARALALGPWASRFRRNQGKRQGVSTSLKGH
jgi:hypothetical protein